MTFYGVGVDFFSEIAQSLLTGALETGALRTGSGSGSGS